MLQAPDLPAELILSRVREAYDVPASELRFLPLGYAYTAVYRVADRGGTDWFLKLRRGPSAEAALALPRLLADRGAGHVIAPQRRAPV